MTGSGLLSEELSSELRELCRREQVTLSTIVQGAWAFLLSRYSGEQEVVFGSVVSGRPAELAGVEEMVGPFINTLPVRVVIDGKQQVSEWLKGLQERFVELREHEHSPLIQIQGWSGLPAGTALFESLVAFQNYPVDSEGMKGKQTLGIRNFQGQEQTNYPLTVSIAPGPPLLIQFTYDVEQLTRERTARMLVHLERILGNFARDAEQQLHAISLLNQEERNQLLYEWNKTAGPYPQDSSIQQLFEAQAGRRPEAVALMFGEQKLSYGELNRRREPVGALSAGAGRGSGGIGRGAAGTLGRDGGEPAGGAESGGCLCAAGPAVSAGAVAVHGGGCGLEGGADRD